MEKGKQTRKNVFKSFGLILIAVIVACAIGFGILKATGKEDVALQVLNQKVVSSVRNFIAGESEEGQSTEVKSISMESNESYASNMPGSWHLDKSAEWTAIDKAKITFDVKSVMKTVDTNYKDVLLVLDISGSMYGDKLQKVKDDSIELVEYLLKDSNNNVGLIVYDDNAETITEFTKDKDDLVSKINALSDKGCTNYNDPLKHVDWIMENYTKQANRDVVTLFLTDGYPNVDTPNQIGTYEMLKSKYPYMAINGIQYEMGASMQQAIVEISDEQWIASMETLENVLFEAAIAPVAFDTFKIEDLIKNEYFVVGSVDDIEVTKGTVNLTDEKGTQKVVWTLDSQNTGFSAQMTINVTLKGDYVKVTGNYPTNKETTVNYKEVENSEQTKQTTDTPILRKQTYTVTYDANAPSGTTVTGTPATESYYPFENVTKKQDEPSCEGWNFKGWEFATENVTKINNDTFVMPTNNVIVKAIWGKPEISKSMEGTVVRAGVLVKYAVQIYGIQQDVDENNNPLGLTFGPATYYDVNNSYITHKYEPLNDGTGNYKIVIVNTPVNADGSEGTPTEEDLKDSSGNLVTRDENQVNARKDINLHNMSWTEIAQQSKTDPTVFIDCMLCGDTKSVKLYLNDEIWSETEQTASGDGAGMIYSEINPNYRKWNSQVNNDTSDRAYAGSRIRATLIGSNSMTKTTYAGTDVLDSTNCLYSCIESNLKNVITAKKVKYVTGSSSSSYQSNNEPLVDKIWLFSEKEVYGTGNYSGGTTEGIGKDGVAYNKFINTESKYYIGTGSGSNGSTDSRKAYYKAGSAGYWWLRSPILIYSNSVSGVGYGGYVDEYVGTYFNQYGLALGFCI